MTQNPTVSFSVVIPLFNKKPFVRAAIDSVLAQDHQASEVIVVDDGSTDGSIEEIQDLLGPRLRIVRQANSGPGAARNRGFAEAQHQWVALLDADDLWASDHLSTLAELVRNYPAADAVATAFERRTVEQPVEQKRPGPTAGYVMNYFGEAAGREALWTSCVAVRREAFLRTAGFPLFWPGEDTYYWAQFALDHIVAATRKVTAYYTIHTGGLIDSGQTSGIPREGPLNHGMLKLLNDALADARYSAMHEDIRLYMDAVLLRRAKQLIYAGNPREARDWLGYVHRRSCVRMRSLRLLAALPGPLLRRAVKAYSWAKRPASWRKR